MDDNGNDPEDDDLLEEDQPTDESEVSEDDAILHERDESQLPRDNI
jgi:hypothetical protein